MVKRAPPMSLRSYATRRGVSAMAVSNAVKTCRLVKSVVRVKGQPKIRDAELADREWDASTDLSKAPAYVKERADARAGTTTRSPPPPDGHEVFLGMSLSEASAAEKVYKAQLAEIDLAERRGELIAVAELEARLVTLFASCKTKLLGIPSRARQADPTLSSVQVAIVESLVREALEDLAEGKLEVDAA